METTDGVAVDPQESTGVAVEDAAEIEKTEEAAEPNGNGEPEPEKATAIEKAKPGHVPILVESTGNLMVDFYNNFPAYWRLAVVLAKSKLVPQKTAEEALATILAGHELGLPAMTSCRVLHVVEGKIGMSADLILGRMLQAGVTWEVPEDTVEAVTFLFKRGVMEFKSRWTKEDSERAGLMQPTRNGKPSNHAKYPRAMFRARAISQGARVIAPDVMAGIYETAELRDAIDLGEIDAVDAEVVETGGSKTSAVTAALKAAASK